VAGFLLHAADVSNSAKTEELAIYWSSRVLSEFFLQGDKEKEMGLPISPLCDRDTVNVQESQINFIKFVIQPTFELLGRIIPRVNEEVGPRVDNTLGYWKQEQQKLPTVYVVHNSYWETLRDTILGFELFSEEGWEWLRDGFEESFPVSLFDLRTSFEVSPYWERLRDTVTEVLN